MVSRGSFVQTNPNPKYPWNQAIPDTVFSGSGRLSLGLLLLNCPKEFEFDSKTVESRSFGYMTFFLLLHENSGKKI